MSAIAEGRDLRKVFGSQVAVDRISFEARTGEVVGLLGANGAGKTTVIRMLLGLLAPSSGVVEVLGRRPDRSSRRRTGYMPQGLGLYDDLTVRENLEFAARAFSVAPTRLDPTLEGASGELVGRLPLGLQRRVAFAAALSHRPQLLVLDEPTSGVGPLGRADLWETIRAAAEGGAAVLVSTHYMDEAEQCDRLIVMAAGRAVAEGSADEIVAGHSVVEVEADLAQVAGRLEGTGLLAVPGGAGVRVLDADLATVASLVPDEAARQVPANLEEVFVLLSTGSA